jgi:protein TonB
MIIQILGIVFAFILLMVLCTVLNNCLQNNLKLNTMKKSSEMIPGFDEIIFRDRNKSYGAYELRKCYKSTATMSVFFGIALSSLLVITLAFQPEESSAKVPKTTGVILVVDPLIPEVPITPEPKLPPQLMKNPALIPPVVEEGNSIDEDYIPTADELNNTITNGDVNDTLGYLTPIEPVTPAEEKTWISVEEMPEYPGGTTALLKFINDNLVYPEAAIENHIQGRVVLKFVVMPDGSVNRIEVLRGIDSLLDNEALKVIKTLPGFKPGKQNGVPVPVWFTIPVTFKLSE